jgi:hypothetical protein
MRKLTLLVCLFGISCPALAAKPISVAQLEQLLTASRGKHDGQIAQSLSQLALTQRMNSTRLTQWLARLPSPKSQQALIALADLSAFLDLPPEDVPPQAAPSMTEQAHMIALSINYIKETIHQLPNLFATQVTTSFQEVQPGTGRASGGTGWYVAGRHSAHIVYRDGGEEVSPTPDKHVKRPVGLVTSGEFGLLGTVLEDALNSSLYWSHWEQGAQGVVAVYRYSVPADKSHYEVGLSSPKKAGNHRVVIQHFSAYTGEIAVDPSKGTIVRLVMKATPTPDDPLLTANILVEYGPLVMDGKTYVCPLRSVALSVAAQLDASSQPISDPQFLRTSLNDVTFEQYHLFHADVRILSGYSVPAQEGPATH